jgi:hypothetical protein
MRGEQRAKVRRRPEEAREGGRLIISIIIRWILQLATTVSVVRSLRSSIAGTSRRPCFQLLQEERQEELKCWAPPAEISEAELLDGTNWLLGRVKHG